MKFCIAKSIINFLFQIFSVRRKNKTKKKLDRKRNCRLILNVRIEPKSSQATIVK